MTPNRSNDQERIPLSGGNSATLEEIKQVWKLISHKRTITVRQIAAQMSFSTSKTFGIITFLKRCGYISNEKHRYAWDVRIPYAEIVQ